MTASSVENTRVCPVCGSGEITRLFAVDNVPIACNILRMSRDAALDAPRGRMELGVCGVCSHVYNLSFDSSLINYEPGYENALHFSPSFRAYAHDLGRRLVESYNLRGTSAVEIGCGDGYFLRLLCGMGMRAGYGFDPSVPQCQVHDANDPVTLIADYYTRRYSALAPSCICFRHVLEHLPAPFGFLQALREIPSTPDASVVYCEVPNGALIFESGGWWDVLYEHCGYFTPRSLHTLFTRAGFFVVDAAQSYAGQFISIDAVAAQPRAVHPCPTADFEPLFREAGRSFDRTVSAWKDAAYAWRRQGKRVVLWGAGSKGVMFLNLLDIKDDLVQVVDINVRKHGKHVPVTGQKITGPEQLRGAPAPDLVLLMNPYYAAEVGDMLRNLELTCPLIDASAPPH